MGLNVGLITTWAQRCGIASYSANLANALAKQDVNVYIIRIPRFGYKDPAVFQNIVDSIPLDKIDLISCQHEYGLYSGLDRGLFSSLKRLGKPLVTTLHAVGNYDVDNLILEASDRVIVHNDYCHKRLWYNKKATVIPHGMTPMLTPPPPKEECKKRVGIQPNTQIVGYLGFISSYKGLETLIEAMTKIPNVGLLIGGGWFIEAEPQYIVDLKEKSLNKLPNRVQWLGFIPDEDLNMVYGAMDIIVYPSITMTESGALLTALSYGKAVITRNLPPTREKAKHGALMLFNNADDLARKIKHLLKDNDHRLILEEGAKKYSQENSWANIALRHIQLYQEVLSLRSEGDLPKTQ